MTNSMIHISYFDLVAVASGILLLGLYLLWEGFEQSRNLWWNSLRMFGQLIFMGVWLSWVFKADNLYLVLGVLLLMMIFALLEILKRQGTKVSFHEKKLMFLIALGSLLSTALVITLISVIVLIQPNPWWSPQYLIPIMGMILGNAMTTIGLSFKNLRQSLYKTTAVIEAQLALGYTAAEAIKPLQKETLSIAMLPIINAMAASGIVSLPGMMTGQILAGIDPHEAVKYQIFIMMVIALSNIIASLLAIKWLAKGYFDQRERLKI